MTSRSQQTPWITSQTAAWLQRDRALKVPEIVAREILQEMVERDIEPGATLPPEAAMMEQFGVGRNSMREALRILEIHGMVRMKVGLRGGPVVTELNRNAFGRMTSLFLFRLGSTYRDLLEARFVIEPMMARLAAERLTKEGAKKLKEVVAESHRAAESASESEAWAHMLHFHAAISGMTGNFVLDLFGAALIGIEEGRMNLVFPPEDKDLALRVHDRIATAILERNGSRAEQLTKRHVAEVTRRTREQHGSALDERIIW